MTLEVLNGIFGPEWQAYLNKAMQPEVVWGGSGILALTALWAVIKKPFSSPPKPPASSSTTATATDSPGAVQNLHAGGNLTLYQTPPPMVHAEDAMFGFKKLVAHLEHQVEAERTASQAERARAQEALERVKGLEDQLTQTFAALNQLKEQEPAKAVKIEAAIEALEANQPEKAEAIFKRVFEDRKAVGDAAHQDAAAAARHLGALAFMNDPKAALVWYRHVTELEPDDPDGWNQFGVLLGRSGDLTGAAIALETVRVLGLRLSNNVWVAKATGNLGIIALMRGDLSLAEEYHRDSLSLEEGLGRKDGVAADYSNLGLIARRRGNLTLAEEYHRKALALHEELVNKEGMAADYGNLGLIARKRGNLPLAEEYHRRALVLEEEFGHNEGVAIQYANLGAIAADRNDLLQAEEYFRKALVLNEDLGRQEGVANQYANLGSVFRERSALPQAREYWGRALALFREIGMPHRVEEVEGWLRKL